MLKQLISLLLINLAVFSFTFAQKTTVEKNDNVSTTMTKTADVNSEIPADTYETMLDNYLKVQFREYAYENLNLTSEEIIALDPLYIDYMKEKSELIDRREKLMENYQREIKEDDRAKDEAREASAFIEDYWETNIEGQVLRKKYFALMDEVIPYEKAFSFFLMEENLENRISQEYTFEIVPVMLDIDNAEASYYREVDRYNVWMQNNDIEIDGVIKMDHQYTYDGLNKLTRSIQATVNLVEGNVPGLQQDLDMIMGKAAKMQEDAYANTHANLAREAFIAVTDVLEDIKQLDGIVVSQRNINAMRKAAEGISPDKNYMDQSKRAHLFFTYAQETINKIYSRQKVDSRNQMQESDNTMDEK